MLLVRDHNAVLLLGYCTWYSEAGSLEALYPHVLYFGLGLEQDITSLQTAQELCEVAQQFPWHAGCTSRRALVDMKQTPAAVVPVAGYTRGVQSELVYSIASCCASHAYPVVGSWQRLPGRESRVLESLV